MANTARVTKYYRGLLSGASKKDAALKAGYSLATAENAKYSIESTEMAKKVRVAIDERIPMEKVARVIDEALDAEKTINVGGAKSPILIETPDHFIRLKGAELVAKIKGEIGGDVKVGGDNSPVQVIFGNLCRGVAS